MIKHVKDEICRFCDCVPVGGLEASVISLPHPEHAYGIEITIYCPMCRKSDRVHLGYKDIREVDMILNDTTIAVSFILATGHEAAAAIKEASGK